VFSSSPLRCINRGSFKVNETVYNYGETQAANDADNNIANGHVCSMNAVPGPDRHSRDENQYHPIRVIRFGDREWCRRFVKNVDQDNQ
jgi:hypothetical protein